MQCWICHNRGWMHSLSGWHLQAAVDGRTMHRLLLRNICYQRKHDLHTVSSRQGVSGAGVGFCGLSDLRRWVCFGCGRLRMRSVRRRKIPDISSGIILYIVSCGQGWHGHKRELYGFRLCNQLHTWLLFHASVDCLPGLRSALVFW